MPAVIRQGKVIATCDVCQKMAHFGYGKMWACSTHRAEVEAMWIAEGSKPK